MLTRRFGHQNELRTKLPTILRVSDELRGGPFSPLRIVNNLPQTPEDKEILLSSLSAEGVSRPGVRLGGIEITITESVFLTKHGIRLKTVR